MIFLTGDTHRWNGLSRVSDFFKTNTATKDDCSLFCGDCAFEWSGDEEDARVKKSYQEACPTTILFVDGNHENFDLLNSYPVTEWHGGKVHKISERIYHLMRGQVFEIEGKTFFTFGGAESTDKYLRREGTSWWATEKASYSEYDEALTNLERVNFEVDYIITHTCDERALLYPPLLEYGFRRLPSNMLLTNFEEMVKYKHWYFGHYHLDAQITDKKTVVFNNILKLNTKA